MQKFRLTVFLMPVTASLLAALLGALGGYLFGHALALRSARARLAADAFQISAMVRSYLDESNAVIAAANASPYPRCSHADLTFMRSLVFHAQYLRDAGRMADGRLECSAILGREGLSQAAFSPDLTLPDGVEVYRDLPPYRGTPDTILTLQKGGAFVVRDPRIERYLYSVNLHFTFTVLDTMTHTSSRLSGKPVFAEGAVTDRDADGQVDDVLYASRCLTRNAGCITTYTPVSAAILADRLQNVSFTVLGALAAAFLGLVAALQYRRRSSMEQQLRRAIAMRDLRLVYQPIVQLATRRMVGAEALARWTDEEGFEVSPEVFVPLAEKQGFVRELTRQVVRQALTDFGPTLNAHPGFRLSLNATASDLHSPGFLSYLEQAAKSASVQPSSLVIEITESSTARGTVAVETILRLRESGYSVHIDDFGTGYSSLSYLQDLAVDSIKIDRSFTAAVGTGSASLAILPKILAMADALHLDVIVEGIETERQAAYFAETGQPLFAQGWLFGHPVPAEQFHRLLAADRERFKPPVLAASSSPAFPNCLSEQA